MKRGIVEVRAQHIPDSAGHREDALCQVVEEDALSLDVEDVGQYTLMWTPTSQDQGPAGYTLEDGVLGEGDKPEGLALAMGFALSEGLIESLADIRSLSTCPDNPKVVQVQLRDPGSVKIDRRNVVISSSCGICGPREILEDNALQLQTVGEGLQLPAAQFSDLMTQMQNQQRIFQQTGGSHAAGLFSADGAVFAVAEDLGRHNAMDKAIGDALLQGSDIRHCGIVLSSRLSLEMVLKAVRSGVQIMLAVSAPTSLAIEVADKFGVTLCGFVRDQRATVYTHPHRILG